MNYTTRTEILAITTTVLAVLLSVGTMDHRYAIERENGNLKSQVQELETKIANPPKFCGEYFRQQMQKIKTKPKKQLNMKRKGK